MENFSDLHTPHTTLKISTDIPAYDWSSFVKNHPNGTVFQSPEMFNLFAQTDKFKPLILGVYEKDELFAILLGVFINEKKGPGKFLSSRFVIYGGPLLRGTSEKQNKLLDILLKELIDRTQRRALFIQFRNFFDWQNFLPVFEKHGFKYLERLNYIVHTQSLPGTGLHSSLNNSREYVLGNMSSGRRRQLNKALKSGAEIIEPQNITRVKDFYNILFRLYRYNIRKPLPDWSFFENFYNQTLPQTLNRTPHPPLGIIRLIKYKDRIIGGILAPVFGRKCIYEWYVCGLDQEYKKQHPSILATWAALEYAIDNHIECFDFMGVGRPDIPYGVREFKARFGGELVNYGRLTRINNNFLYHVAELGYNVLAIFNRI